MRLPATLLNLNFRQRLQALAGLALLADTIILVAGGRINTGTLLPGAIGLVLLGVLHARHWIARQQAHRAFRLGWRMACTLAALWLLSFVVFTGVLLQHGYARHMASPQAILVLGAGVHGRDPTPTLISRLSVATALAARFPAAPVVVSGGQGPLEDISEAEAMRNWLLAAGLDRQRILLESRSTSTAENFAFSRPILQAAGIRPDGPLAVVTSSFHVLRAEGIAAQAGYAESWVVPAPTPPSIAFNNYLREYFAWGKSWLFGELPR